MTLMATHTGPTAKDCSTLQAHAAGCSCCCTASYVDFLASHVGFLAPHVDFLASHADSLAAHVVACPTQVAQSRTRSRHAHAATVWHMGVSSGVGQYLGSTAAAISATSPSPYSRGYLFRAQQLRAVCEGLPISPKTPSIGTTRRQCFLALTQDTRGRALPTSIRQRISPQGSYSREPR